MLGLTKILSCYANSDIECFILFKNTFFTVGSSKDTNDLSPTQSYRYTNGGLFAYKPDIINQPLKDMFVKVIINWF